eukprot:g15870.t1
MADVYSRYLDDAASGQLLRLYRTWSQDKQASLRLSSLVEASGNQDKSPISKRAALMFLAKLHPAKTTVIELLTMDLQVCEFWGLPMSFAISTQPECRDQVTRFAQSTNLEGVPLEMVICSSGKCKEVAACVEILRGKEHGARAIKKFFCDATRIPAELHHMTMEERATAEFPAFYGIQRMSKAVIRTSIHHDIALTVHAAKVSTLVLSMTLGLRSASAEKRKAAASEYSRHVIEGTIARMREYKSTIETAQRDKKLREFQEKCKKEGVKKEEMAIKKKSLDIPFGAFAATLTDAIDSPSLNSLSKKASYGGEDKKFGLGTNGAKMMADVEYVCKHEKWSIEEKKNTLRELLREVGNWVPHYAEKWDRVVEREEEQIEEKAQDEEHMQDEFAEDINIGLSLQQWATRLA